MKELKLIPADKIDKQDHRFIYREGFSSYGWALPAFWENNGRYIPVSGLYEPKGPEVNAFVYSKESDIERVLVDTLGFRELNIFDVARLLKILEEQITSADRKAWSRTLKIPEEKWENIMDLANFDKSWQDYFIDKNAPLKLIMPFGDKELRTILKPLLDLNLGINLLVSF